MSQEKELHFFLSSNTPQGFVSRFDQFRTMDEGWRTYIIKGGPGCGKSNLMKRLAKTLRCPNMELIHCSADAHSLDGIILRELRTIVVDGTAPHPMDCKYPGAYDSLVPLGEYCSEESLRAHRKEIAELFEQYSLCNKQCQKFLYAAGSLLSDSYHLALSKTDLHKISRFVQRFATREMKQLQNTNPKEEVRFLSAVTAEGIVTLSETVDALCTDLYFIEDDYGAVSRLLLAALRREAMARGYDVITCYCPMAPFDKIDHLFIPALSIGFMTQNKLHKLELTPLRTIHAQRFTDMEELRERKVRFAFNNKAAKQMLAQARVLMQEALEVHNRLEAHYKAAMNFEQVEIRIQTMIDSILLEQKLQQ